MSQVKIRNACLDDSSAIARLMPQLGYPTTPDEMRERLEAILSNLDYITFIAEVRKEVVGMVGAGIGRYYESNGVYGRLLALVVDERWRGRGIGASLVARAERWLKARQATSIVVNSGRHRSEAHRFYSLLGYEETGVRFVKLLS